MNSTRHKVQLAVLSTCCESYCSNIIDTLKSFYTFLCENVPVPILLATTVNPKGVWLWSCDPI